MLGMGNAWWSVLGLLIDIVGFNLLALEGYRAFFRQTRADFFRSAAAATRKYLVPVPVDESAFEPKLKTIAAKSAWRLNRWAWYRIRLADFRELGRWFVPEPDFGEEADIFDRTADEILSAPLKVGRPGIVGFILVNLGFVLQAWGTVPIARGIQ